MLEELDASVAVLQSGMSRVVHFQELDAPVAVLQFGMSRVVHFDGSLMIVKEFAGLKV